MPLYTKRVKGGNALQPWIHCRERGVQETVEKTGGFLVSCGLWEEKQIPFGNDKQKGKGKKQGQLPEWGGGIPPMPQKTGMDAVPGFVVGTADSLRE